MPNKGNGNNSNAAAVIGTIDRFARPGWREDYVLRVIQPSRKNPEPKVELRVWVVNEKTDPPFKGLSTRGGYFAMTIEQFNKLVELAPAVREAIKALTTENGEPTPTGKVPSAPSLDLLAGVTGRQ